MLLHKLNSSLVKSISGQQTIPSLGAAIKELIENALDAVHDKKSFHDLDDNCDIRDQRTNHITVHLKQYGLDSISVSDDGSGISSDSYHSLTKQYTTSKIESMEDFQSLSTFGFRGTALASICNVAGEFRIITRTMEDVSATELNYSRELKLLDSKPVAREVGTTVLVSRLFDALPVRRKVLEKGIKKEYQKALKLIQAYAIISKQIKLTFINEVNGKKQTIFSTRGTNVQDNLSRVLGAQQFSKMEKIEKMCDESFSFEGFISKAKPQFGRSQNDRQFLFLNGRPVDLPRISKMIQEVYKQYNMHQVPAYVIDLQIDMKRIDINVSSDKRSVFIKEEDSIIDTLREILEEKWKMYENQLSLQQSVQLTLPDSMYQSNVEIHSTTSERLLTFSEVQSISGNASRLTNDSDSLINDNHPSSINENSCNSIGKNCIKIDSSCHFHKKLIEESASSDPSQNEKMEDETLSTITETSTFDLNDILMINRKIKTESSQTQLEEFVHESQKERFQPLQRTSKENTKTDFASKNHSPEVSPQQFSNSNNNQNTSKRSPTTLNILNINEDIYLSMYNNMLQNMKKSTNTPSQCKKEEFTIDIGESLGKECEDELNRIVKKSHFGEMRIIGQFNKGFIIAEHGGDLFVVDQHASDEKYNFEMLQRSTVLNSQPLIVPKELDVSTDDIQTVKENEDIFKKCGFAFHYSPEMDKLYLKRVPVSKNITFNQNDFQDLLAKIYEATENQLQDPERRAAFRPTRIRSMFASRACRTSVMVGTTLSHLEMKRIVQQLGELDKPWNCPHGRPTLRHLTRLR